MHDDDALMLACRNDPARFGGVFERHHRVIWTYVARLAGTDIADDLTAEVFAAAFARRASFDPALGAVRSWLYGIASNLLRQRFRDDGRARRAFERATRAAGGDGAHGSEPEQAAERADAVDRTRSALAALSHDERELIVLYAWEELGYAAIAEVLGVPVGTVKSRLGRARARLRDQLALEGAAPAAGREEQDRGR